MSTTLSVNGIDRSKWARAALASVAAAVVANLIAFFVISAVIDLPPGFQPLSVGAITFFTIIGTGLGALVFRWLAGRSANPARSYTIVAVIALIVSILPNLAAAMNPAMFPFPGGTATAFLVLTMFHVIAAAVSVAVLLRLSRAGE